MWSRMRLKIGWSDLLAGGIACVLPGNREKAVARVESYWGDDETIAAFSVRTGFDLLLQTLELVPGDEIIFSALNINGMIKIVNRLDLVPVPADLDVAHFAPQMDKLEQAVSPRSRVLVVAHLFGTRIDMAPIVAFARKHNILLVEDCAQAFDGQAYKGNPDTDVCMFSFGPLKQATALGGALIRVRDKDLRERMRARQTRYPVQPTIKQFRRVVQFVMLKLASSRLVMGQIYRFFSSKGQDYEEALGEKVRDVAPLNVSKNLRFRPSLAMLRLMDRRLRAHGSTTLAETTAMGRRLSDLIENTIVLPARANQVHNYWVFPVLVDKPLEFVERMRSKGFDCANLPRAKAVPAPKNRPDLVASVTEQALSDLVVVPCYPGMPDSEIQREAEAIKEIAAEIGSNRTRSYSDAPA